MQKIAQSLNDILIADLPSKIRVNNNIYNINCDYRTIIRILIAMEDPTLYHEEKIYIMLKLLYKEEVSSKDIEEACRKASLFIDMGKEFKNDKKEKRIYSFTKDGNYILTGINSTHKIDISETPMLHWWKFMVLFMDMSTECFFNELIYYRKRKAEGKLTKEEKIKYKKIKELVDLDEIPTEETIKLQEAKSKFLQELNS